LRKKLEKIQGKKPILWGDSDIELEEQVVLRQIVMLKKVLPEGNGEMNRVNCSIGFVVLKLALSSYHE